MEGGHEYLSSIMHKLGVYTILFSPILLYNIFQNKIKRNACLCTYVYPLSLSLNLCVCV